MANTNSLSALTREKFIPVLVDNIYNSNVLCNKLLKNGEQLDGGVKIITPIEYAKLQDGGTDMGWIGTGGATGVTATDTYQKAEWDWATAYAGIKIEGDVDYKNRGDSQVLSLVKAKLKTAEKSIKDMFGTGLFNAGMLSNGLTSLNGGGTIASGDYTAFDNGVGIIEDLGSDTTVYHSPGNVDNTVCSYRRSLGGINSDSLNWWNAKLGTFELSGGVRAYGGTTGVTTWTELVTTVSGVANMVRAMTRMYGACTIDADAPDLIVTTQAIYDAYESSLQANKRFEGDSTLADYGFDSLRFKGASVVVDSHCPAGQMYFLNTDYLDFKIHNKRNFAFEDFKRLEGSDNIQARIFWMGQMVCTNPRMQGVLAGGPSDYA